MQAVYIMWHPAGRPQVRSIQKGRAAILSVRFGKFVYLIPHDPSIFVPGALVGLHFDPTPVAWQAGSLARMNPVDDLRVQWKRDSLTVPLILSIKDLSLQRTARNRRSKTSTIFVLLVLFISCGQDPVPEKSEHKHYQKTTQCGPQQFRLQHTAPLFLR